MSELDILTIKPFTNKEIQLVEVIINYAASICITFELNNAKNFGELIFGGKVVNSCFYKNEELLEFAISQHQWINKSSFKSHKGRVATKMKLLSEWVDFRPNKSLVGLCLSVVKYMEILKLGNQFDYFNKTLKEMQDKKRSEQGPRIIHKPVKIVR